MSKILRASYFSFYIRNKLRLQKSWSIREIFNFNLQKNLKKLNQLIKDHYPDMFSFGKFTRILENLQTSY